MINNNNIKKQSFLDRIPDIYFNICFIEYAAILLLGGINYYISKLRSDTSIVGFATAFFCNCKLYFQIFILTNIFLFLIVSLIIYFNYLENFLLIINNLLSYNSYFFWLSPVATKYYNSNMILPIILTCSLLNALSLSLNLSRNISAILKKDSIQHSIKNNKYNVALKELYYYSFNLIIDCQVEIFNKCLVSSVMLFLSEITDNKSYIKLEDIFMITIEEDLNFLICFFYIAIYIQFIIFTHSLLNKIKIKTYGRK